MTYDLDTNPLAAQEIDVPPGGSVMFPLLADCEANKFLRAEGGAFVLIEGRFVGVGEFVNLQTTGLDTTAHSGMVKAFDIRVTADEVGYTLENVEIEVKA